LPGKVTKDSLEKLKSVVRLEDFIGAYVELKKAGDHYAGKCPFHADDSPSFAVYPDHFYCYGCKANGDAFSFLEKKDALRFPEAVEAVAARVGFSLEYEEEKGRNPEQEKKDKQRRDALYLLDQCAEFFHRCLLSPAGDSARAYLLQRGYDSVRVAQFRLGLNPGFDALVKEAQRRGWNQELLLSLSLIQLSRTGKGAYDFFRDRLLVPIQDEKHAVVGFGGRSYLPEVADGGFKSPKYLNSKESFVFNKSHVVFNLNRARSEIARTEQALLVEGYFDCLSLSAAGIENVVAALSTTISPVHLEKLAQVGRAKELLICFDSDKAGQEATLRFFEKVFPLGKFELRALQIPNGKDPDEFIRSFGKSAFLEQIHALAGKGLRNCLWRSATQ
jgi:DNA primase